MRTLSPKSPVEPSEVYLRQLLAGDVTQRYVGWLNNPEINRYLEIRHQVPLRFNDVREFVLNCLDIRRHHWGIFVRDQHVGNVSCSRYVKQAKLVDVSNIIGEERYRQSDLAKFALASAVDHLFFVSGYDRVQAGTYVDHFSGITLLTNLGFKKAADLSGLRPGAMRYEVLKDDWSAHPSRVPRVRVEPPPWESGTPDSG